MTLRAPFARSPLVDLGNRSATRTRQLCWGCVNRTSEPREDLGTIHTYGVPWYHTQSGKDGDDDISGEETRYNFGPTSPIFSPDMQEAPPPSHW